MTQTKDAHEDKIPNGNEIPTPNGKILFPMGMEINDKTGNRKKQELTCTYGNGKNECKSNSRVSLALTVHRTKTMHRVPPPHTINHPIN